MNTKIENFINRKTELDNVLLPQNYPSVDEFEKFQSGYKTNGLTNESITGNKEGDFKDSWYVICSNYFNDPFIIDFIDEDKGFPVYFAFHGMGSWALIKISENIEDFSNHLMKIKLIENEKEKVVSYLIENLDIKNDFWEKIFLEFQEQINEEFSEINEEFSEINAEKHFEDWILGKLYITSIGVNKLKVVKILKEKFKLTPQQALSLSKQNEIEFAEGYLKHLKFDIERLNELGVTTDFRKN